MTNTAAKGRNFEYVIRNLFLRQGFVVGRCAASKPWDLTVATEQAVYAIECKLTKPTTAKEYNTLMNKLQVRGEDGYYRMSKLIPLLFYKNKGKIEMYSEAYFANDDLEVYRPYFEDGKFSEIPALGKKYLLWERTGGEKRSD